VRIAISTDCAEADKADRYPHADDDTMALRELPYRTASALCRDARPALRATSAFAPRYASSDATKEVELSSSLEVPPPSADLVKDYDPVARSRLRRRGNNSLPPSRYRACSHAQPAAG
jgi:large subunit ribosomal protein L5